MTDFNPEHFEAELAALKPVAPPEKTLNRILTELELQSKRCAAPARSERSGWRGWPLLPWLAPTAAAATVVAVLLAEARRSPQNQPQNRQVATAVGPSLKADKVEIDRQLVADFDAIGRLPTGEPIRFRCQQWMDKVWLRDSAAGLVLERTTPRLEIVPVRFETY